MSETEKAEQPLAGALFRLLPGKKGIPRQPFVR
jgi:hypothetical protein